MKYDFSEFLHKETFDVIDTKGKPLFSVTVREITNGDTIDAQAKAYANLEIPIEGTKAQRTRLLKANMQKAQQSGVTGKISVYQELASIESWTLKLDGKDVPICEEAWRALPRFITDQISEVIERVNPEMDDTFPDKHGNKDTAKGDV